MPIYDYKCQICDKKFEILQKMDESDLTRYPGCDNKECLVKRCVTSAEFHLKGKGWYKTDYGK